MHPDDDLAITEPTKEDPPASRRPPLLWLAIALTLAVMALGAWLAVTLTEVSERREADDDRNAVRDVAGRFATALYSYDHRDLDASKRRVLDLSTGAFRREYQDGFVAIETLVTKAEATSRATVGDVFTTDVDGAEATCVVLVDTSVSGLAGRRSESSYTRLSLVKVNGKWRVDGVLALGAGSSRTPSDPPMAPTTTAPTATPTTASTPPASPSG